MKKVNFTIRTSKELDRIVESIRSYCSPAMVVLFGEYVDGTLRNARKGYELLILTDKECAPEDIFAHLAVEVRSRNRYEKKLTLYVYRSSEFMIEYIGNYFFHTILTEGVLLYSDGSLPVENIPPLKIRKFMKKILTNTERFLSDGSDYLSVAEEHLKKFSVRVAAANLYFAVEQFLFAMEFSYFGFCANHKRLNEAFMWTKITSKLLTEWNGKHQTSIGRKLSIVERMAGDARCNQVFSYSPETILNLLVITREIKFIAEKQCSENLNYYSGLLN
ncbi:MAG: hypothetical protein LIO79_00075 [Rikenellaceae bacterium]|nr:hypothetical protein [Rikenellaceae bacterium]